MKVDSARRFRFVLPLPRFVLHPFTAVAVAAVHVYLAAGHLAELAAGHVEWTHLWKGFGALAGAYVFAALASRRMPTRLRYAPAGAGSGMVHSDRVPDGKPILTKVPKLLLNDDKAGKPEGIHLVIGRRPVAAFGNSIGDKEMLEYTGAGDGARLAMLVHHDDAGREYDYGPKSKVGTFTDALMAEAKKRGWIVISMKNDWKRIFAFE